MKSLESMINQCHPLIGDHRTLAYARILLQAFVRVDLEVDELPERTAPEAAEEHDDEHNVHDALHDVALALLAAAGADTGLDATWSACSPRDLLSGHKE